MYCTNCGKEVNENAYICINCGALIADAECGGKTGADQKGKEWTVSNNKGLWTGFASITLCMIIFMLEFLTAFSHYSCSVAAFFLGFPALVLGCVSIGFGISDYNQKRYGAATMVYTVSAFVFSVITCALSLCVPFI